MTKLIPDTPYGIALLACLLLAGCDSKPFQPINGTDQCMRREIFKECMAALPAGPKATHYNDWSEVVSECDSAARYQAIRRMDQIKMECRPQ